MPDVWGRFLVAVLVMVAAACGPGTTSGDGAQQWPYDEHADAAASLR